MNPSNPATKSTTKRVPYQSPEQALHFKKAAWKRAEMNLRLPCGSSRHECAPWSPRPGQGREHLLGASLLETSQPPKRDVLAEMEATSSWLPQERTSNTSRAALA